MTTRATRSLPLLLGAFLAGCGGDGADPVITVAGQAGPMAGIDVVFHDAEGEPVVSAKTDGAGRASADVDGGGMITVLLADTYHRNLYTFTGVERGDELRLEDPRITVAMVGTAYVSVPSFPGAGVYVIDARCSTIYTANVSQPIPVEIRSNCLAPDGTLQLLVTAYDAAGQVLGVAFVRDLTWTEPMNLVMPPWTAPSRLTVDVRQGPAGTVGAAVQVDHVVNGARLSGASEGRELAPGQPASFALAYAGGLGDFTEVTTTVAFGTDTAHVTGMSKELRRWATPPGSYAVDLTADLLPQLWPPTYDPSVVGRPAMRWTETDVSRADGGAARFAWIDWDQSNQDYWAVLIPPDVGMSVQVPALPAELAEWGPGAAPQFAPGSIHFVDAGWLSSYDELRREAGFGLLLDLAEPELPDADASLAITVGGL